MYLPLSDGWAMSLVSSHGVVQPLVGGCSTAQISEHGEVSTPSSHTENRKYNPPSSSVCVLSRCQCCSCSGCANNTSEALDRCSKPLFAYWQTFLRVSCIRCCLFTGVVWAHLIQFSVSEVNVIWPFLKTEHAENSSKKHLNKKLCYLMGKFSHISFANSVDFGSWMVGTWFFLWPLVKTETTAECFV